MGGDGFSILEIITYHALALGFIASTFEGSGILYLSWLKKKKHLQRQDAGTMKTAMEKFFISFSLSLLP